MKFLKYFFFLSVIGLASCEAEDQLTPNPNYTNNVNNSVASLEATIDGVKFTAVNPQANITTGLIAIAGHNSAGQQLSILLDNDVTGAYDVNKSGSVLLQFLSDSSKLNGLYSSFNANSPVGTINITSINTTAKTISGTFTGEAEQSFILATNPEKVKITRGTFNNIPYATQTNTFNFGGIDFKVDGQTVSMNTATADLFDGAVNSDTYKYYNFSSATSDFGKSIIIELEENRAVIGMTTKFNNDAFWNPIDEDDSLAFASYSIKENNTFTDYESQSGSITITNIETKNGEEVISADFNFEGRNSGTVIKITEGKISAVLR